MPQLSFSAEFADMVASGKKCQTIRAPRKDGRNPKPGDTLYLKSGPYKGKRRNLGEVRCKSVHKFEIRIRWAMPEVWIWRDTRMIRMLLCDAGELARRDGFQDAGEMFDYFEKNGGLPFEGYLIKWDPAGVTNPERGAGGEG